MSSDRACIAGPAASVLHRLYLDATADFLAVLLGRRLQRTTSEATDADVAKVTATTDFVITNVFIIEKDDGFDFKNGQIRTEKFQARAKKMFSRTELKEKLDFLGFLSYRKGWPEGVPPLASQQDRCRMAALGRHLPAKARLYCLVTEVASPTTLGVKHVTSVLVVEGDRVPMEVTTLGQGGDQRYQEAVAPSILSSLMEEVGLKEEVAVLASTREKFRRMLRSMAEEGEVVAKELVQEEEDAVGLQEEVQELEQRLELRLRGGEQMVRLAALQGPALEAVTMLLQEMGEEEEEAEVLEEVTTSSDATSMSDGMMDLDIDKSDN